MSRLRLLIGLILACLTNVGTLLAQPSPQTILVFEPSSRSGTFYPILLNSFVKAVGEQTGSVTIFTENVDFNRFTESAYRDAVENYLRQKYGDMPVTVIVAITEGVLKFALDFRSKVLPSTPIVFSMVEKSATQRLTLGSNSTGTFITADYASMLGSARTVVPGLRRVILVGADLNKDPLFGYLAPQIKSAEPGLEIVNLTGLPLREALQRTAALPDDSAILYTSLYGDGDGHYFAPLEGLRALAKSANRPIIVSANSFIGAGAAGGFVMKGDDIGREAANLTVRVLNGERVNDISATESNSVRHVFDWRELQRWKVNPASLPAGSVVEFRPMSLWEKYTWQLIVVASMIIALFILLVRLLFEQQNRRRAENESRKRLSELAHVNRYATAGEMSGAIAHELNQPLGAIMNNANAAELLLQSKEPKLDMLKEILSDIRRDDTRASEIIKRLRGLLTHRDVNFHQFDLNDAIGEAVGFAEIQAVNSKITIHKDLSDTPLLVFGDRIEIQQVLLNLVMNSVEAINARDGGARDIVCQTKLGSGGNAEFSVSDSGPGISNENLSKVFEPFFTSKRQGMGMGLSLAQTIVKAHGGLITADNGMAGGAIFRVRLPMAH